MARIHNHHAAFQACTPECPVHPLNDPTCPASIEELLEERQRLLARVKELEAQVRGLRSVGIS